MVHYAGLGPPVIHGRWGGRSAAMVAVVGVLMTLGACQGSDSEPTLSPTPTVRLARSVGSLPSYCEIQGLRKLIADGEVKRSQLPGFADMTEVEGTPLIVDFKKDITESHAATLDRLFSSPGLNDVRVNRAAQRECLSTTTEADVERSQGGPGYLAKPSDEPTP